MFALVMTAAFLVLAQTKLWSTFKEAQSERDEVLSLISQSPFLRSAVLLQFYKKCSCWFEPCGIILIGSYQFLANKKRHHARLTPVTRQSLCGIPLSTAVGSDAVENPCSSPVTLASKVHLSLLLLLLCAKWILQDRGVTRRWREL